jgi:hypothetical protein
VLGRNQVDATGEAHQLLQPETMTRQTPYGEVYRLAPPVDFSETPGYWDDPILTVRGSCKAEWATPPKTDHPIRQSAKAAKRDRHQETAVHE